MLAHCDPTQPFGKLGKAIAAALRKAYVDGQQGAVYRQHAA